MAVPANICVAWPSTVASIPAGWTRETSLDARYILGAAGGADTDLTTDRGNTTHTHTSPSHTPTQNSHTHTVGTLGGDADTSVVTGTTGGAASDFSHGHDASPSDSAVGTNNGVAITVDATSNDLAYVEVIWIKSDGTPSALPLGSLAFFASDSLPASWSRVHGNRYLKGAATAADGGSTGGSNTHTHTSPAHTHTQVAHSHTATSLSGNVSSLNKGVGIDIPSSNGHSHALTLNAATPTNQSVTTTIASGDHEPPFTKINIVQAAAASLPTDIICLWLGTNATIPTDWTRYTTLDARWAKAANADGESGVSTGGSSQHTHTASDCQPIQNAHAHTVTDAGGVGSTTAETGAANTYAAPGHKHSGWTVSSETPTNNSVAVTIDNCTADAALPKHRTVIFVRFTGSAPTPPRSGVWTSYDIGRFDVGDPEGEVLPEIAKKIAQSDLRYVPR